ncbi:MAG TPA: TIGR02391 family protein [Solirubrobacterales bacterium]
MSDWPPSAEEVDGLPVDALGIRLLRYIERGGKNTLRGIVGSARSETAILNERQRGVTGMVVADSSMPLGRRYELSLGEAWHWLIAAGLITEIPMDEHWFVVSRLGEKVLKSSDPIAHVRAEQRIALDLHPLIHSRVRSQFLLGEYDAAVLIAMRTVEERVRKIAGASDSEIGVKLMKRVFGKEGPLRDAEVDPGEADGQMALFWGAIAVFKNPASHRRVDYDSPTEASEVVLLADLLLRILDRIETDKP